MPEILLQFYNGSTEIEVGREVNHTVLVEVGREVNVYCDVTSVNGGDNVTWYRIVDSLMTPGEGAHVMHVH